MYVSILSGEYNNHLQVLLIDVTNVNKLFNCIHINMTSSV